MTTTKPFIHLLNEKSPELHCIHERMKVLAAEYLIAFDNDVQDIGTPNSIAEYFLAQVVDQAK